MRRFCSWHEIRNFTRIFLVETSFDSSSSRFTRSSFARIPDCQQNSFAYNSTTVLHATQLSCRISATFSSFPNRYSFIRHHEHKARVVCASTTSVLVPEIKKISQQRNVEGTWSEKKIRQRTTKGKINGILHGEDIFIQPRRTLLLDRIHGRVGLLRFLHIYQGKRRVECMKSVSCGKSLTCLELEKKFSSRSISWCHQLLLMTLCDYKYNSKSFMKSWTATETLNIPQKHITTTLSCLNSRQLVYHGTTHSSIKDFFSSN